MDNYIQYAAALWAPQAKKVAEKHGAFMATANKKYVVPTPDEEYFIYVWYDLSATDKALEAFLYEMEHVRHSIIGIRDDGFIIDDIDTEDSEGCDEYLNEILDWTASVVMPPNLVEIGKEA